MKKVLAACLKEVIQFDSVKEMYVYIGKLRERKIPHTCISHTETADGKVVLTINKAYNNVPLIED